MNDGKIYKQKDGEVDRRRGKEKIYGCRDVSWCLEEELKGKWRQVIGQREQPPGEETRTT